MKPITTDTYDFSTLIEGGYVYVDKTAYLRRMISGVDGMFFFMSRPRRFGKSLMLTIDSVPVNDRKALHGLLENETRSANVPVNVPGARRPAGIM